MFSLAQFCSNLDGFKELGGGGAFKSKHYLIF